MDNRTARTKEFASRIERGLIPAIPIPFDSQGRIQEAAQECHIRYLAQQPIAGVAVWVHTGRGLHLDRERRRSVLAAWRKGLPSNMVIVAGAGAPPALAADYDAYVRAALEMAEDAFEGGADALLVHPPRVADITGYHRLLAGTGLPLLLFYLYEGAGGVSYSEATLRELLSLEATAGIKMATLDSVLRYQEVSRLLEEFPERLLVTGEDRFFGYSFMRGARAALVGMGAACCRFFASMMKAWFDAGTRAGAADEFLKLSAQVDELAEAIFVAPMEGYIQRMLLVLAEQGIIPETATFDPWGPALNRAAERARIRVTLQRLGLEHG
ncbi:MAG: dihydrodipicolinate synthase family protein [Candidatus Limnocylindria bacterium]